ncbi:MAG: hypothetical protein JWQ09_1578 [Segetibacter sp.]|nr:hypothetical protein [Segetibacter sp.]
MQKGCTEYLTVKKGDKFIVPFKPKEVKYTALDEMVLTLPPENYGLIYTAQPTKLILVSSGNNEVENYKVKATT